MTNTFDNDYWTRENYFALAYLLGQFYMDEVIRREGLIWSDEPTPGAKEVISFFQLHGITSILDVGCGYGRDAVFFAERGFNVTGIEYSAVACETARGLYLAKRAEAEAETWGNVIIVHADFRTWECAPCLFDAAFSFKTLHQFRHNPPRGLKDPMSASAFVKRMACCVRPGGLLSFSTFSTNDHNYGKGKYIEEDTYDTRGHRPCAFYSEERFRVLLKDYDLLHVEHLSFEENHLPDDLHRHVMWFAVARIPKL